MGDLRRQDLIHPSPSGRGFFAPGLLQRHCYGIKKNNSPEEALANSVLHPT